VSRLQFGSTRTRTSTASFAKFSRIKRYQGKILAVTNVLVQVSAENLKYKSLYRYMSCPQTFAKIPTDQRELCERGCTSTRVWYSTRYQINTSTELVLRLIPSSRSLFPSIPYKRAIPPIPILHGGAGGSTHHPKRLGPTAALRLPKGIHLPSRLLFPSYTP